MLNATDKPAQTSIQPPTRGVHHLALYTDDMISTITRRKIRRGVFKSVADLETPSSVTSGLTKNVKALPMVGIRSIDLQKLTEIPEPSE